MGELLKRIKWNLVLAALVYLGLGLVLLFWPDVASRTLCILLGVILMGYGFFQVVGFFQKGEEGWSWAVVELVVGVGALALGIFVLVRWEAVVALFPKILGLMVIVDSCVSLKRTLQLKRSGLETWWVDALLAAIPLVFGVIILFNSYATGELMVRIIGGVLVYEGVTDIVTIVRSAAFRKGLARDAGAIESTVTREEDL